MKTKTLLIKLAKLFPKKYAKENHDFVGLMCGKLPEDIHKIVLCLDMDASIFAQVKEYKPDLVLTHHPFIYGPKSKVLKFDENKRKLVESLEEIGVPVYSMHTNFDTGHRGMNDALAEALELENIYIPEKEKMMRIGYLKEAMEIHDFAVFAKQKLHVEYGLLIAEGTKEIRKVGIIGGGGSRDYPVALEEGCDIYISGDAPHHVRREIVLTQFNYLDLPHEIEKIFMPQMKKILLEMDSSLEIIIIDHEVVPEVI